MAAQKDPMEGFCDWCRQNLYTIALVILVIGIIAFLRDIDIIPRVVSTATIILLIVGVFLLHYSSQKKR